MVRTLVHRGLTRRGVSPSPASAWLCGGWPSTSPAGSSRSPTRPVRSSSSPMARSTTSRPEAGSRRSAAVPIALGHRGPGPRLRAVGRGPASAPSRDVRAGVVGRAHLNAWPPATAPARSRSIGARLSRPAAAPEVKALLVRPEVSRELTRGARPVPHLRIHRRTPDHPEARAEAASGQPSDLARRTRR